MAADRSTTLLVSGTGEVLAPDDEVVAVGSGGSYALAAARALLAHTELDAREVVEEALPDRRRDRHLHQRPHHHRGAGDVKAEHDLTPREIVAELDRYIVGQKAAKRAVAVALRNRWRRQQLAPELRDEVAPKNIIMMGPTGVGKTEIARRLARLTGSPFLKVEASKFTEVGYVGRDVESIVRDLVEAGDPAGARRAGAGGPGAGRAGGRGPAARPAADRQLGGRRLARGAPAGAQAAAPRGRCSRTRRWSSRSPSSACRRSRCSRPRASSRWASTSRTCSAACSAARPASGCGWPRRAGCCSARRRRS